MSLLSLPPEVITVVVSQEHSLKSLRNLSLSCRALYDVVERDGWKAYVTQNFPSFTVPKVRWSDAARGLIALNESLDRRALISQRLDPIDLKVATLPRDGPQLPQLYKPDRGQSMGYQPVIDSYEQIFNNSWISRTEVVAWAAGPQLIVNLKSLDFSVKRTNLRYDKNREPNALSDFLVYKDPRHVAGRDDITAVKLLRPHQRAESDEDERVMVGRANGELNLLRLSGQISDCEMQRYETDQRAVRCADLSSHNQPLLTACIGDDTLALYKTEELETGGNVSTRPPESTVQCVSDDERGCRSWDVKFLSNEKVAVSRGVSTRLIYVYGIRPESMTDAPIHTFGTCSSGGTRSRTSAYPIARVPDSHGFSGTGCLLYSGGYDGIIRLHDTRSSRESEATFHDPSDFSSIFSLATFGRERIVAGGSMNTLLKFFDIRMPGGRRCYTRLMAQPSELDDSDHEPVSRIYGWDMYMHNQRRRRRENTGPIYSLSRPSDTSTSLYVGLEANVSQITFCDTIRRSIDPLLSAAGNNTFLPAWIDRLRVDDLAMFEQQGNLKLLIQRRLGTHGSNSVYHRSKLDERWEVPKRFR